jgi:hypothetical protein
LVPPVHDKEKTYHELLCGKDENMCGLDSYPGIYHEKRSEDMIERFIREREAAWYAKKRTQTTFATSRERVNKTQGKKIICNSPGVSD